MKVRSLRPSARGALHRFRDPAALSAAAADALCSVGRGAIEARGRFMLALSGGSTPAGLYRRLASPPRSTALDWGRVEFFWGDERAVGPDHEESNYGMAQRTLLDPLRIDPQRVHRMKAESGDLETARRDYEHQLAECFEGIAGSQPPRFDLILLGLGEDGHVASLFPHTAALEVTDRWIVVNRKPDSGDRLTMSLPLINRARVIFVLVSGTHKAGALADAFGAGYDPARFPSHGLRPGDGRLEWFVDAASVALLATGPESSPEA